MKRSLRKAIEDELPSADYPDFEPGDKIRVTTTQEIQGQQRKRHFEGVCIARRGEGPDRTFKVRKVSFGVGVERIYPLHSPIIDDIEIVKKGKVRRAKLTYLEGRSAKDSRIEEERVDLEEINRTRTETEESEPTESDEETAVEETPEAEVEDEGTPSEETDEDVESTPEEEMTEESDESEASEAEEDDEADKD